MAEQRIKGPVTLLSPSLINQSGAGIALSQPQPVLLTSECRGGGALAEEEPAQPVSAVDCSSTANLMTRGLRRRGGGGGGGGGRAFSPLSAKSQSWSYSLVSDGLLFYTTSAILITVL